MPEPDSEPRPLAEPVEAPEPQKADHLLQDLAPRLSKEKETELAARILANYHAALQDRAEWEARLVEWEDQFYGRLPDKSFPWPGAANFHVPLTMMGVETYKPRLIESVLGQNPPLIVMPVEGTDEDRRDRVEQFLNWQILTELDIEPKVYQSSHLFLQPGLVIAKTSWKIERTWRKFVREFPLETELEGVLEAIFGAARPTTLEQVGPLHWEGELPAQPLGRDPLQVTLKMTFLEDSLQVLVEKEEVRERPHVDLLDPIDFIAPARGGHEVMELPWCQHRLWLYEDDLRRKVLLGRFYPDRVQELLNAVTVPGGDGRTLDATGYKEAQSKTEGVEHEGPSNVRRLQYEVLEDYRRWDVDGDGLEEEILVWVAPQLDQKILGWDYLDNVYAHGRRPFRVGRYFPVPFRFYGLSFPEVIKGIQDEINTIHNQRVDYGTITNLPFFFYRASATLPAISQRLVPGEGVPLDNPQTDVNFPKWSGGPQWGQSEEQILHQYFERLTGLTDLTLGRQPNRVGATRTAKGTQTLLSEAGLRFKTAMQAFQRFWVGIFEDILALDQEYLPPGKEFRVTGKRPEFIRVKDRTEIGGRFDVRLASTAENMNREQMRNDAAMMLQVLKDPIPIQAGLVGLKGLRRVYADLIKAFGKDPDYYLEQKAIIHTPEEELALFVSGVYVDPTPGEDVRRHLEAHQLQLMDPALAPYMKPEVIAFLKKHLQATQQLVQAMQLAQTMQAESGPRNAANPPSSDQAGNVAIGQAAPQAPGLGPGGPVPQGGPGGSPGS